MNPPAGAPGNGKEEPSLPATEDALRDRARIYRFFSLAFARELDAAAVESFRAGGVHDLLRELRPSLSSSVLVGDPEDAAEELACEFARLFVGPGPLLPPYQSCHDRSGKHDGGRLWAASTSRIFRFVRDVGLEFGESYQGIPDHISLVFEMMQRLLDEEAEAEERGLRERADAVRRVRRRFFDEHVDPWSEAFFRKVADQSRHIFYRTMGELASEFMNVEERVHSEEGIGS